MTYIDNRAPEGEEGKEEKEEDSEEMYDEDFAEPEIDLQKQVPTDGVVSPKNGRYEQQDEFQD